MSDEEQPKSAPFAAPDVSFARVWSEVAPGLGGWRVIAEGAQHDVRLVSVIPPGAESPVFFISRDGQETVIQRLRPFEKGGGLVEAGRFETLREAVLALCPVDDESLQQIHEQLEVLHPRDRPN